MKTKIVRALGRIPALRLLPGRPGRQAAISYLHRERQWDALVELLRDPERSLRYASTGLMAIEAAIRRGHDELADDSLAILYRRFPERAEIPTAHARLRMFQGRYDDALELVERARLISPSHAPATAALIRLAYDIHDTADADTIAVDAVARFPESMTVLWAACHECTTPTQYERLWLSWSTAVENDNRFATAVRPLAAAAQRAGMPDTATDLYQRALTMIVKQHVQATPVKMSTLGSHDAWEAIDDLCDALTDQPHFFAAGTALGLIREGKPLPGDDDIDVGIFSTDWDGDKLAALFAEHPMFLPQRHPLTRKIGLVHRGGARIDVFPYYVESGRLWHDGVFVRWHNDPFTVKRIRIGDRDLPVPHEADTYLTTNYGDWRTPQSGFDAFTNDAPNVQVTWPECHRLHLVRRAYRSATKGDLASADASLALARNTPASIGT